MCAVLKQGSVPACPARQGFWRAGRLGGRGAVLWPVDTGSPLSVAGRGVLSCRGGQFLVFCARSSCAPLGSCRRGGGRGKEIFLLNPRSWVSRRRLVGVGVGGLLASTEGAESAPDASSGL